MGTKRHFRRIFKLVQWLVEKRKTSREFEMLFGRLKLRRYANWFCLERQRKENRGN